MVKLLFFYDFCLWHSPVRPSCLNLTGYGFNFILLSWQDRGFYYGDRVMHGVSNEALPEQRLYACDFVMLVNLPLYKQIREMYKDT